MTEHKKATASQGRPRGITLVDSTGSQDVDHILTGLIGVVEAAFPNEIRSWYLYGSYARGTVTETSDMDVVCVFRGVTSPDNARRFREVSRYIRRLCPSLDVNECDEDRLFRHGAPVLCRNTLHLYGEDIRSQMPANPVDFRNRAMYVPYSPYGLMSSLRRSQQVFVAPLGPIDENSPYLGYDTRRIPGPDGTMVKSVKMLLSATMHLGVSLIGVRTGISSNNKAEFIELFREHVGGEWADFADEVFHFCVNVQKGWLPEDEPGKARLKELCERMLIFENAFLNEFRETASAHLNADSEPLALHCSEAPLLTLTPERDMQELVPECIEERDGIRWVTINQAVRVQAAAMLGRVIFPGDEIVLEGLETCARSEDPLLRSIALRSLATIKNTKDSL